MKPPVTAPLMCQGEAITAFLVRVLFGVETLVNDNPLFIEKYRAQDVGALAEVGAGNTEQTMGIVELNAELEVLLNNVFDGNRRFDDDIARMGKLCEQCFRVAFDGLSSQIWNKPCLSGCHPYPLHLGCSQSPE